MCIADLSNRQIKSLSIDTRQFGCDCLISPLKLGCNRFFF